jgi:hypothetical protein
MNRLLTAAVAIFGSEQQTMEVLRRTRFSPKRQSLSAGTGNALVVLTAYGVSMSLAVRVCAVRALCCCAVR